MQIFPTADKTFGPADARSFVGTVETMLLASNEDSPPVHMYHVKFQNGGRTNWHKHSGPQWLFIISGRVRVQRWGDPPKDVSAGDAVLFAPGEKHWHGAVPGSMGSHLAVNIEATTEWLEPVTDREYNG